MKNHLFKTEKGLGAYLFEVIFKAMKFDDLKLGEINPEQL